MFECTCDTYILDNPKQVHPPVVRSSAHLRKTYNVCVRYPTISLVTSAHMAAIDADFNFVQKSCTLQFITELNSSDIWKLWNRTVRASKSHYADRLCMISKLPTEENVYGNVKTCIHLSVSENKWVKISACSLSFSKLCYVFPYTFSKSLFRASKRA